MSTAIKPKGTYGVDAPWVPWMWVGFTALYVVLAILVPTLWNGTWQVGVVLGIAAFGFAVGAGLYWQATFRGKFVLWNTVLNMMPFTGTERVLDLGCGRGAVAIQTALRIPAGHVTGIDLWRTIDQSGNSAAVAQRNAQANSVAHIVSFATGDMTELPYANESFDLVTASLSIHNIPTADARAVAVSEAWRVLAPGGELVIVDIQRTREYYATLRWLGAQVSEPRNLGWRMWWSGPWMATKILHATKA